MDTNAQYTNSLETHNSTSNHKSRYIFFILIVIVGMLLAGYLYLHFVYYPMLFTYGGDNNAVSENANQEAQVVKLQSNENQRAITLAEKQLLSKFETDGYFGINRYDITGDILEITFVGRIVEVGEDTLSFEIPQTTEKFVATFDESIFIDTYDARVVPVTPDLPSKIAYLQKRMNLIFEVRGSYNSQADSDPLKVTRLAVANLSPAYLDAVFNGQAYTLSFSEISSLVQNSSPQEDSTSAQSVQEINTVTPEASPEEEDF